MKKKIMLLLGCVLFVILSVGSVPSENKDNVEVKKESETTTSGSSNGSSNAAPAEKKEEKNEEKKEYEIQDVKLEKDDFATYVTGVLINNGKEKGYVQVMIPCYDKSGAKLGDALANVNNIEQGGKWKFKAMFLGDEKVSTCDVAKIEVSGF